MHEAINLTTSVLLEMTLNKWLASDQIGKVLLLSTAIDLKVEWYAHFWEVHVLPSAALIQIDIINLEAI